MVVAGDRTPLDSGELFKEEVILRRDPGSAPEETLADLAQRPWFQVPVGGGMRWATTRRISSRRYGFATTALAPCADA